MTNQIHAFITGLVVNPGFILRRPLKFSFALKAKVTFVYPDFCKS